MEVRFCRLLLSAVCCLLSAAGCCYRPWCHASGGTSLIAAAGCWLLLAAADCCWLLSAAGCCYIQTLVPCYPPTPCPQDPPLLRQGYLTVVAKRQNWWAESYVACTSLVETFHFGKQFLSRNLAEPVADARLCCARAPAHRSSSRRAAAPEI